MSNLLQRSLSSLILVPCILFPIFKGGFYFHGLCFGLFFLCIFEWLNLGKVYARSYKITLKHIVFFMVGVGYISISIYKFWTLNACSYAVLMTFLIVWSTDIGAYVVGKILGKTPLAIKISPNKTWEGFFGGIVTCIIICLLAIYHQDFVIQCLQHYGMMISPAPHSDFVSLLCLHLGIYSIFAHLGDLLESFVKRYVGVKDSSQLIPGHGGFLDRFDSFLAVCLSYYLMEFISGSKVLF